MPDLKLIALDAEDLSVISAHLQDAVLKVADRAMPRKSARPSPTASTEYRARGGNDRPMRWRRRLAAIRFERSSAPMSGIDLKNKSAVLSLLAIGFEPAEAPGGDVMLLFADGGAIRLRVEVIEAELKDLGPVWQAKSRPQHPDDPVEA